jgi:hypothetical protein
MSIIEPGQLGKFSGKIGQVVVSRWRGKMTGRKTPAKSAKPQAPEVLIQQEKMSRVSKFLRLFSEPVAVGWGSRRRNKTPFNEAVSYHIEHAVTGEYPEYHIDYERVLITRGWGIIDGGFKPLASVAEGGAVNLSWMTSNSTSSITQLTDELTVIFLDVNFRPGKVLPVYYEKIAERKDLKATFVLPEICIDHPLHMYMFFVSKDGKLASRSEYLGLVTPL